MPRKGAATAAPEQTIPNPGPEYTDEVSSDLNAETGAPVDKPARPTRNRSKAADTTPENGFEDWTKPVYASDPGEFEFGTLDDEIEWLSILWWGKEGTGKTTDLARVAATKLIESGDVQGKVLIINAEGGAKRTPLRHHGIDTSRIVTYPKQGQALTFEGLERLFYKLQDDLDKDPHAWAAVGWDSITAIVEKLLDDVVEADMRKTAEILQRAKKGRDGRSGNITMRERFELDGEDYIPMSNQVRLLLRKYRTLPCHFLVTALERRDEDKKRKVAKVQYGPAVNPAISTALLGYVDVAIRTLVLDDATYYGRTTPTEDSRGKDRMFSLPVEMVDPTFDRILAYVRGELKHEDDPAQKRMPGGAEGVLRRRSLDEEAMPRPEQPVEEAEPEPPKRGGRRRGGASSGQNTASAPPSATGEPVDSEPDSAATEPASAASPPKAGGRRLRSTSKPSAEPSEEKTAGTEEPAKPARRSGRKPAADRAARAEVKADTEPAKSGPATRAANERAQKAAQATGGIPDEPPF